jgi:hypothetical protein
MTMPEPKDRPAPEPTGQPAPDETENLDFPEHREAAEDRAAEDRAAADRDQANSAFPGDDEQDGPLPREPRSRAARLRTAGRVSARVATGIIVLAAVGATVAAASFIPLPGIHRSVSSTVVTPVASAQQLVCPGGLLRLSSETGAGATKASALGPASVSSGSTSGAVGQKAFSASDAGTASGSSAPQLLSSSAGVSTTPALIAGAQSQSVSTDEFVGLASAACAPASGDAWLVGGATSTGRTTLVLLSNPSDVPATVSLQVFGENGRVTAPGMDGIAVASQGQRVISLAGFAPGLISPIVHVSSRGGQVAASLEQSTVRGIEPGGIDFVGPEPSAAKSVVIPGVVIASTDAVQDRLGEAGFDDLQTTLRIFTGSTKATSARVSVIDEDGKLDGSASQVDLTPSAVTDVPLVSLANGSYTVIVTAKASIVASVRVSTAGSAAVANATDFAWAGAAPLLVAPAAVSIAPGLDTLHLENPSSKSETVTVHAIGGAASGADATVAVLPKSAASVPVLGGSSYELSGYSALHASVSGSGDGAISGYVVYPSQQGSTPIRIYH